jgi:hypothetical protein
VSGSEAASDVCTWFKTQDDRRFAKVPNTPSPTSPSHAVQIDELPTELEPTWSQYFGHAESDIALTGDEWWAAVTWRAADGRRYCWMYIQRTLYTEHRAFGLPA